MSGTACADRGADLFVLARGEDPGDPGLASHVASCAACRGELEALRFLARRLPLATGSLAPRPATREAVRREVLCGPVPLPRTARRGLLLAWIVPAGLVAASVAALVIVMNRPGTGSAERTAGVAVSGMVGAASLPALADGVLAPGETVTAARTLTLRLGSPLETEAVFGAEAVFRIPAPSEGGGAAPRVLEIASGVAFLDAAKTGGRDLEVRAGPVGPEGAAAIRTDGARFTVEVRANGALVVYLESGAVTVAAAGGRTEARGPARIDVPPGGAPSDPVPAEPTDATGWFAYPEVTLALEAAGAPDGRPGPTLRVVLTPSVPRAIPIAPLHRFDPVFVIRATGEGGRLREIPLLPSMLLRPAPEPGPDGAFPLAPDRPYELRVDPMELGLETGTWKIGVLYNASRPGGLWRGSRASNPVELRVP